MPANAQLNKLKDDLKNIKNERKEHMINDEELYKQEREIGLLIIDIKLNIGEQKEELKKLENDLKNIRKEREEHMLKGEELYKQEKEIGDLIFDIELKFI